jgi:hypothetical protein
MGTETVRVPVSFLKYTKLEDVQTLAGHREPRTTGLYDRRKKLVTRDIVERISI